MVSRQDTERPAQGRMSVRSVCREIRPYDTRPLAEGSLRETMPVVSNSASHAATVRRHLDRNFYARSMPIRRKRGSERAAQTAALPAFHAQFLRRRGRIRGGILYDSRSGATLL